MDQPLIEKPPGGPPSQPSLSLDRFVGILWESLAESFVNSILVLVFGNTAIGIAGGICKEMMPSRPPGFEGKPEADSLTFFHWDSWTASARQHQFGLIFTLVFILTVWGRLGRHAAREASFRRSSAHINRIRKRISEEWFGLIVSNAFGALISAIVVVYVQQYEFPKLVFRWILGSFTAAIQSLLAFLFGAHRAGTLEAWFNWYGENQLQFTFWFFYVAAICDDLGIPNFKSLGRWVRRRIRSRLESGSVPKSPPAPLR
jgi:hypothetical protein